MELVERLKQDTEFRDVKVTPLLVLAKALCLAVRRNPEINASWDEAAQEIVVKHYVNLGIAAATPRGLIVPEHQGRRRDVACGELAEAIGALDRHRPRGPHPAGRDVRRHDHHHQRRRLRRRHRDADPQPGRGRDPVRSARSGSSRGSSPTRQESSRARVTTLALSFDHRLVDGELGSRFLADVAAILEDPSRALVWA